MVRFESQKANSVILLKQVLFPQKCSVRNQERLWKQQGSLIIAPFSLVTFSLFWTRNLTSIRTKSSQRALPEEAATTVGEKLATE